MKQDKPNGCGPAWLPLNVPDGPDGAFYGPCVFHDLDYQAGGSERDRLKADWRLYKRMIARCSLLPWYKRPLGWLWAGFFFVMVLCFGWTAFSYKV